MMNLAEIQQAMQERVLHGTRSIEAVVSSTTDFDKNTRLGIYQFAFTARLIEASAKTFEALQATLGSTKFSALIKAYVQENPPSHFSIRYFGNNLPSFIPKHFSGIKALVLSELALWEWLLAAAFDAPDAKPLGKEVLSALAPTAWTQLRFSLSPSLHKITLQTNAVQWWRAATNGLPPPARFRKAKQVTWIIWRKNMNSCFRSLQPDEAIALDAVIEQRDFSAICEILADNGHAENAPLRAATLLNQWFNDGFITDIKGE